MIAGQQQSFNPLFGSVRFPDGSSMNSAKSLEEIHVRKRFRVSANASQFDHNVTIGGNLTVQGDIISSSGGGGGGANTSVLENMVQDLYTKIGWDVALHRWKYTHYENVDSATLDFRLQDVNFQNYYTKNETDVRIFNSSTASWEYFHGTGVENSFVGNEGESYAGTPHTKLAVHNTLIIPRDPGGTQVTQFVIQNSNYGVGKVLTSDSFGNATWQPPGSVASVASIIHTTLGQTHQPSFAIQDTDSAWFEVIPNKLSATQELARAGDYVVRITQGIFSMFVGQGGNISRPAGLRLSNTDGSLTLVGGDTLFNGTHVWAGDGGLYLGNTFRMDPFGVHMTHASNQAIHLYGKVEILRKESHAPTYNRNSHVESAKLQIGNPGSGIGDLIVENKINAKAFQFRPNASNTQNMVLTSDAQGNASWQLTQAAASGISTFTDDVSMNNLTIHQQLVTTEIILSDAGNTILNPYNHAGVTWSNGENIDAPHPLTFGGQVKNIELIRNNEYTSDYIWKNVGTVTIPPNHRGTIKIHLPLYVQHQYNYKYKHMTANYMNEPTNETGFHYTIVSLTTTWRDAATYQDLTTYTYEETAHYSSHQRMLGSAYVQHHRSYSKTNVNSSFFRPYSPWHWTNDQITYHPEFERTLTNNRHDPHKNMQYPFNGFTGKGEHNFAQVNNLQYQNPPNPSLYIDSTQDSDYTDDNGLHTTHHIVHVDTPHLLFSPPSSSSSKQYQLIVAVRIKYVQKGPSLYNGAHGFNQANTLAQRYPHMTLSFGGARPYLINWWRWKNPTEGIIHIKDIQTGRYINPSSPYWTIDTPPIENVINPPYPLLPYFNLKKYPATTPQFGYINDDHTSLWNVNEKKYVAFMTFADGQIAKNSYRNSSGSEGEYAHIVETSLEDGGYQPYIRVFALIKFRRDLQIENVYVRGNGTRNITPVGNPNVPVSPKPTPERIPVNVLQYRNTPWKNLEGFQIRVPNWQGLFPPRTLVIRILALVSNLPSSFPIPAGHPSGFAPQALPPDPYHDPVYLVRINLDGNSHLSIKTYTQLTDNYFHSTQGNTFQSHLYETTYPNTPYVGYENYISSPTLPPREVIQSSSNNQLGANQFPNMNAFSNSLQLAHLFVSNLQAQLINTPSPIRCQGIYTRASNKDTAIETELGNVNHVVNWSWEKDGLHFYVDEYLVGTLPPNFSDHRIKIDVRYGPPNEESILDRICELPLFQYTQLPLGEKEKKSLHHFGFYAHEIQSLFPEFPHLVSGFKDGRTLQSINYNQLTILLLQAIKEIRSESLKIKKEVRKLKQSLFMMEVFLTLLFAFFLYQLWKTFCGSCISSWEENPPPPPP